MPDGEPPVVLWVPARLRYMLLKDASTIWDEEISPLLARTVLHCVGAIGVGAMFAFTAWVLKNLSSVSGGSTSLIDGTESFLLAATVLTLGLLFLNALIKLIADAFRSTWKGFWNVTLSLAA